MPAPLAPALELFQGRLLWPGKLSFERKGLFMPEDATADV